MARQSSMGVLITLALACGGDDGGTTATATTTVTSTSGEESTGSTGGTTEGSTETTGGSSEDPSYPAPDDAGACPPNHAPLDLPGGQVCAPFCSGPRDACPDGESGDATPDCTPFEQPGGSGTMCQDHMDCPEGEGCVGDVCVSVAFWACRLLCEPGQTCPDSMTCSSSVCGYP